MREETIFTTSFDGSSSRVQGSALGKIDLLVLSSSPYGECQ
jgi:hypothetical protein